ncbi:MAG: hypothetical protein ACLUI3_03190 [Christensenellales bacterium]
MTFTVRLIQNSGSKSSAALTFEAIERARLRTLWVWDSGATVYGRFTWERVKEDKAQ